MTASSAYNVKQAADHPLCHRARRHVPTQPSIGDEHTVELERHVM
jgi:hypothetical protein